MKKLIVVADWAVDSLAMQEFRSAVEGFLKTTETPNITYVASTPSTIHASYVTGQLIENEDRLGRPHETILFQNIDPRLSSTAKLENGQGGEFYVNRLAGGMIVCGPNAGYNFSLIKSTISQSFIYRNLSQGSQFRSRDLFSRVCAHLMESLEDELELEEVGVDTIPRLEGYYVGHIDNYGNIKTTIRVEDMKGKREFGEEVDITINNVTKKARFVQSLFGDSVGNLVIYPGSSGPKDNPYLEVSVWRHFTEDNPTTGIHEFGNPKPGAKIELVGV